MTKKKQVSSIERQPQETTQPAPHPTQAAFEPTSTQGIWGLIAGGFLCLAGFGMGLGWWLDVSFRATMDSVDLRNSWLYEALPFIFPIFLPLAGYAWWLAWQSWQQTRVFERSKETTTGIITHLWIDPPRPPGRRYYVGYQFGPGHSAYQTVPARTYKRLSVGQTTTVEYATANPQLSRLNLKKQ